MKKMVRMAVAIAGSWLLAGTAQALSVFEYTAGPSNFGCSARANCGGFDGLFASYNEASNMLTWEVEGAEQNGVAMDGFWLVLNDGPDNPKGDDGLAIFYADFNNDGLWAYEYNGRNDASSYQQTDFLGFFDGLTNTGDTRGFSIDVSTLGADATFGEEIGIWFHATFGTTSSGDASGLDSWAYASQGWYDRSGRMTDVSPVPIPGAFFLFAPALAMLAFMRRKFAKS